MAATKFAYIVKWSGLRGDATAIKNKCRSYADWS